jgi:hypothetical protein
LRGQTMVARARGAHRAMRACIEPTISRQMRKTNAVYFHSARLRPPFGELLQFSLDFRHSWNLAKKLPLTRVLSRRQPPALPSFTTSKQPASGTV